MTLQEEYNEEHKNTILPTSLHEQEKHFSKWLESKVIEERQKREEAEERIKSWEKISKDWEQAATEAEAKLKAIEDSLLSDEEANRYSDRMYPWEDGLVSWNNGMNEGMVEGIEHQRNLIKKELKK